jgi:hypothetical protein
MLKRNPVSVLSNLVTSENGTVLTKVPCKIQIPSRFIDIDLAQIGTTTMVLGCFALILENGDYSVCSINTFVELVPFKTLTTVVNEVDYHEFYFEANSVVIKSSDLVRRNVIMYDIFNEFMFRGKIPWYIEYDDLGKLFDSAKEYGDSPVGTNLEIIEFITAMITRSSADRSKPIRCVATSYADIAQDKISYVPLMSVFYSVNNSVNKLAGAYFNDGVISALVQPASKVGTVEQILRT